MTLGVLVDAVTFWALSAPVVYPSPDGAVVSTLGEGAPLAPLFGPLGERLPYHARVFAILSPLDRRSDQEVTDEAWSWFDRRVEEHRVEREQKRKKLALVRGSGRPTKRSRK